MGVGVEVGLGGSGVTVDVGIAVGSVIGESVVGIAVDGSEVPQAAASRASAVNEKTSFIIGLILAHMVLLPERINRGSLGIVVTVNLVNRHVVCPQFECDAGDALKNLNHFYEENRQRS